MQSDPAGGEGPAETVADLWIMGRQDFAVGRKQEREFRSVATVGARVGKQVGAHGQGKLDTTRAAANHRDATRPVGQAALLPQCGELAEKRPDRLDRDAVFGRAGNMRQGRGDSDIDGKQIIGHGRAAGEEHPLLRSIDADRVSMYQPCACHRAEAHEIDVSLFLRVQAGNDARQHPGVGSFEIARHQGQAHPRLRPHRERFQDMHMRVSAAKQNDVRANLRSAHHGACPVRPVMGRRSPRPSCAAHAGRRKNPH